MLWGIFIARNSVIEYEFVDSNEKHYIVKLANHPKITLRHVEYFVVIYGTQNYCLIIDGRLLLTTPLEIKERFLTHFHHQLLIPNQPVDDFLKMATNREFEKLVYEFGSVDPLVLRRYLPDVGDKLNPLVVDAVLIEGLTAIMKKKRKVWLSNVDISKWTTPDFVGVFQRLLEKNVIVMENNSVAFKWAVTKLVLLGHIVVEFKANVRPKTMIETMQRAKCDPRMAIDRWIDARKITSSLLFDDCEAPTIETPTIETPTIVPFASFKECRLWMIGLFIPPNETLLIVSDTFEINPIRETIGMTCQLQASIGKFEKNEFVVVSHCSNMVEMFQLCNSRFSGNFAKSIVFESVRFVEFVTFDQFHRMSSTFDIDWIICVFSQLTPDRWKFESTRFRTKHTFLVSI